MGEKDLAWVREDMNLPNQIVPVRESISLVRQIDFVSYLNVKYPSAS